MTVKEIVKKYLQDNGYVGLSGWDDCSCSVDDFCPCGDNFADCQPEHKHKREK